jgi:hypothetical protein
MGGFGSFNFNLKQCYGSGSAWIRIHFARLDPDSCWECGSGSRKAKMTAKSEEIHVLNCWMFFKDEDFFCTVAWTSFMEA